MNLVNFTSRDSFFKPKYGKDIYMHELFKYFFFFSENWGRAIRNGWK